MADLLGELEDWSDVIKGEPELLRMLEAFEKESSDGSGSILAQPSSSDPEVIVGSEASREGFDEGQGDAPPLEGPAP